ncbi:integrase, catalytic region, zinc finger, CCHC-type containing protein [Tanacetum coccineum]
MLTTSSSSIDSLSTLLLSTFTYLLMASSSLKSSSTNGDNLVGRRHSSNVTLSESLTLMRCHFIYFFEHLDDIWRKYMWLGLNLGRNGQKFNSTRNLISRGHTVLGDGVMIPCDDVKVFKRRRLGHNLFSVGQFCDGDLKVAFRSKTCYVRNLEGDDLLTGKSKKATLQPKLVPSTHSKLELIHMDLCGPMRVESTHGKKYMLVIVDDYSRYTWYFLRIKDEAPKMIKKLIAQKFNYTDVKSASTPTDLERPLVRYLKGKPSLGLWYSKDSPLELVAYTDSDYTGATLDRKSTFYPQIGIQPEIILH